MNTHFTIQELNEFESLEIRGGNGVIDTNGTAATFVFNCNGNCSQVQCGCNTPVYFTSSCGKK